MEYRIQGNSILVTIPAKNSGRFRFQKRKHKFEFGETFSTRTLPFDKTTYLEWQIGYDVPVRDVERGAAQTRLTQKEFVGSNGKRKYPYELSEIFCAAMEAGLFSRRSVRALIDEIRSYRRFIDEKVISVQHHSKRTINGLHFEEASVHLPTLFMVETPDEVQIEVSIKKQQYASGVQPMVYFCIPLTAFRNHQDILGRPSTSGDRLTYVVNEDNAKNIVCLMKIFGMASERHQHDIVRIGEVLLEGIGR